MASLLDLILAKVRGGPLDYLPAEPEPRTTADGGLDLRALLTGAQVQPEAKSQYEPTLAAGEQRSIPELQDMLWNVVNSAGMESLPGIGPHKVEQRAPGRRASAKRGMSEQEFFDRTDESAKAVTVEQRHNEALRRAILMEMMKRGGPQEQEFYGRMTPSAQEVSREQRQAEAVALDKLMRSIGMVR